MILLIVFGLIFIVLFYIYNNYSRKKEIIEYFPKFFQEVYNCTSSGMSLIEAIRKSKNSYYGRLTPLIRNMCSQIEWGIPFSNALRNFSNKINDSFVNKVVTLTEKAANFSPDISKSIKDVNDYVTLTIDLERERSLELFPQVVSIYFVFFVFLFIIYILFNFFITTFEAVEILFYKEVFKHLIIIEAILAGLVLGKISEDSYLAGVKHLIFLLSFSIVFILII